MKRQRLWGSSCCRTKRVAMWTREPKDGKSSAMEIINIKLNISAIFKAICCFFQSYKRANLFWTHIK